MSWYKRDVKKQRFQVRYWLVSNIFIFLYISREKFVEKFSKCCEKWHRLFTKGKIASPSFPSSLGNVFTATNSKYRQLSTGKILLNVEVNRSFSRTLKRNALNSCIEYVCEFCRSTTGGFQIPLPTGLGN